jgi:hypothetical protein
MALSFYRPIDGWSLEMSIEKVAWQVQADKWQEEREPALIKVLDLIDAMDGFDRTELALWKNEGNSLIIGGGFSDFFNINACVKGQFYSVENEENPCEMMDLVVGGQTIDITKQACVNRLQAREIARCFFERTELCADFSWIAY